jgi:hypothetical protein
MSTKCLSAGMLLDRCCLCWPHPSRSSLGPCRDRPRADRSSQNPAAQRGHGGRTYGSLSVQRHLRIQSVSRRGEAGCHAGPDRHLGSTGALQGRCGPGQKARFSDAIWKDMPPRVAVWRSGLGCAQLPVGCGSRCHRPYPKPAGFRCCARLRCRCRGRRVTLMRSASSTVGPRRFPGGYR